MPTRAGPTPASSTNLGISEPLSKTPSLSQSNITTRSSAPLTFSKRKTSSFLCVISFSKRETKSRSVASSVQSTMVNSRMKRSLLFNSLVMRVIEELGAFFIILSAAASEITSSSSSFSSSHASSSNSSSDSSEYSSDSSSSSSSSSSMIVSRTPLKDSDTGELRFCPGSVLGSKQLKYTFSAESSSDSNRTVDGPLSKNAMEVFSMTDSNVLESVSGSS
ncbi:hypothetical protein HDK64DRAFT_278865 [Phyllosticta capitalensis]